MFKSFELFKTFKATEFQGFQEMFLRACRTKAKPIEQAKRLNNSNDFTV
jgi:hypothetical protein